MIEPAKRKAIYLLHQEGMGIREISRHMNISTNTVSTIIDQGGELPQTTRSDKIDIDAELVSRIYLKCNRRVQRTHEILSEEHGIDIGYSTLSRIIREFGFGKRQKKRCHREPDEPGAEMQHDTSPYRVKFKDKLVLVQGSLLYFRYCKVRYLKFYRSFDRFKMKCFFHEALTFWGYVLPPTIIGPVCLELFDPDLVFLSLMILTRYPVYNVLSLCDKINILEYLFRLRNIPLRMVQIM